ncbi:MAG TPA: hypothetical protein VMS08_03070 [Candidatus Saccharimonadia bacterium]|nr:hypothetical protein [Candidatus Saccharimonadia bacterium]
MKKLIPWAGASLILVIIFGTMYGIVQQSQRRAANDPQIQLAQDAATALNRGASPRQVVNGHVNMQESLAPFVIVYNKSGQVVVGSGYLGGTIPKVPYGVLTAANNKPYWFVTWQPQTNVRIAAVSVTASNYYVLSGRSLTVVEVNEQHTLRIALLGAVAAMVVLAGMLAAMHRS